MNAFATMCLHVCIRRPLKNKNKNERIFTVGFSCFYVYLCDASYKTKRRHNKIEASERAPIAAQRADVKVHVKNRVVPRGSKLGRCRVKLFFFSISSQERARC